MIFYLNYVSLNIFWLKTMDTKLANASTRNAIISARVQLIFFFLRHTTLLRALHDYSKNGCVDGKLSPKFRT